VNPKPLELKLMNATMLLNATVSAGKLNVIFAVSNDEVRETNGSIS
jgi:hypothetical protein